MRRLSHSSISDYERCPLYFKLIHIEGHEPAPQPYFSFGSSLHGALEYFYSRRTTPPSLDELLAHLDQVWESDGYQSEQEEAGYRESARQILTEFHRLYAPTFQPAFTVEKRFQTSIAGVPFTGYIDRIDKLESGGLRIVDYKSGVEPFTRQHLEQDRQLTFYQIACEELYDLPVERLVLYHLRTQTPFEIGPRQEEAKQSACKLVAEIAARIEAGEFEPKEGPRCPCEFDRFCPYYRHRYAAEQKELCATAQDIQPAVDEYLALKQETAKLEKRTSELAQLIHGYCEEHELNRLYASEGMAITRSVSRLTEYDPEVVETVLREAGLWDAVSELSQAKLRELVKAGSLDADLLTRLQSAAQERVRASLYLRRAKP